MGAKGGRPSGARGDNADVEVTGAGFDLEIETFVDHAVEDWIAAIEILDELTSAEFCSGAIPPVGEWHCIGIAFDRTHDDPSTAVSHFAFLRTHIDAVIFDQHDSRLLCSGSGDDGMQIRSEEVDRDEFLQEGIG